MRSLTVSAVRHSNLPNQGFFKKDPYKMMTLSITEIRQASKVDLIRCDGQSLTNHKAASHGLAHLQSQVRDEYKTHTHNTGLPMR